MMKRVLFLCTGNSCRSQMAEALTNFWRAGEWEAVSAGTFPTGYVHPLAIVVLQELGISTESLHSKSIERFQLNAFDLIITVCDDAQQNCPMWLGKGQKRHVGFPDPAHAMGSESEKLAVFRQVRDQIQKMVISEW